MEYDVAELSEATHRYSKRNLLGRGGFGSVFKGRVRGCLDVAVKVLTQVSPQASLATIANNGPTMVPNLKNPYHHA